MLAGRTFGAQKNKEVVMDYEWIVKKIEGQPAIGYEFICESKTNNIPVMAAIYCFPKLDQFGSHKIATVTIFWECNKSDITDGFFHWVLDDIGQIIKDKEKSIFDESLNPIEIMLTQQFFCKKLPNVEYFTHGDYYIGGEK